MARHLFFEMTNGKTLRSLSFVNVLQYYYYVLSPFPIDVPIGNIHEN